MAKRGDWVTFSRRLAELLRKSQVPDSEITKTIEEIKAETGTTMTIASLRDVGYWKACREGRRYFDTSTKAGLALSEHLDPKGQVVSLTFRLAKRPAAPAHRDGTGREAAESRNTPLRERLAALEHEQWVTWTRHFLYNLTPENMEKWRRQIDTPYEQLRESEKNADRKWADRVLELVRSSAAFEISG